MPSLPLRPCSRVGCRELVASGQRCPEHGGEPNEYEANREPAHERGYDHAWARCRAAYLAEHPWCELRLACQDAPITARLATEVHHRQTIRNAPERRLDWSNLVAVCRPCHTAVRERIKA